MKAYYLFRSDNYGNVLDGFLDSLDCANKTSIENYSIFDTVI